MTRPTLSDIDHGLESWDAVCNTNNGVLVGGPFPIKVYATVADLPAAGADNVNCLAATTTPKELWMSDGSAWRSYGLGEPDRNGARGRLTTATALLSGLSGASVTSTGLFPAGARAIGLSLRVTTLVTSGAGTSFDVGDGTDVDRYAAACAFAAGTTKTPANATADPGGWRAAAGDVVLTCNGGTFSGGAVRLVALYQELTAPTS